MSTLAHITSATVHARLPDQPIDAPKADHSHAERNILGDRVRDGAIVGGVGGALFGVTMGGIYGAMALGALTEGLPAGVTSASRIPLALKGFGAWAAGGIAVGIGVGAAIAGAYGLLLSGNERFHM